MLESSRSDVKPTKSHIAGHAMLKYSSFDTVKHWMIIQTRQQIKDLNLSEQLEGRWDIVLNSGRLVFALES